MGKKKKSNGSVVSWIGRKVEQSNTLVVVIAAVACFYVYTDFIQPTVGMFFDWASYNTNEISRVGVDVQALQEKLDALEKKYDEDVKGMRTGKRLRIKI